MKYILIVLTSSSLLFACTDNNAKSAGYTYEDSVKHAQMMDAASDSSKYTTIQWLDSTSQNLGKVKEGETVEVSWKFKNTGNQPLIVTNATASCGCTVAEKPEEPIAPGAESVIKAKFDSRDRQGSQHKQVFVEANTKPSRNYQLSFDIEVTKP